MSPTLTLHLPSREVGTVTLMSHHGREDRNWTQGRLLAVVSISSGSLAEPQGSWCLLLDIFNFWLTLYVEAPNLTGKFTASHPRRHTKPRGTGMISADVVCSAHDRWDRE